MQTLFTKRMAFRKYQLKYAKWSCQVAFKTDNENLNNGKLICFYCLSLLPSLINYFFIHPYSNFYALFFEHNKISTSLIIYVCCSVSPMASNVSWVMEFLICGYKITLFSKKINVIQGNCCILWIDIAWGLQTWA